MTKGIKVISTCTVTSMAAGWMAVEVVKEIGIGNYQRAVVIGLISIALAWVTINTIMEA